MEMDIALGFVYFFSKSKVNSLGTCQTCQGIGAGSDCMDNGYGYKNLEVHW